MAFPGNYIDELKKNVNVPDTIIEITLDSGVKKFGFYSQFSDVTPALKSVSSLRNKIDIKSGFATLGKLTAVIIGRENFKDIIKDEYLKNRRVTVNQGFLLLNRLAALGHGYKFGYDFGLGSTQTRQYPYSDYVATFTGRILDWSRKGEVLTLSISDDMESAKKNMPVEDDTGDPTQQIVSYQNANPADIMINILSTQLGIESAYIDSAKFNSERDMWLQGFRFQRVLVDSVSAKTYLNELQTECGGFIFHDGQKLSFKMPMPLTIGESAVKAFTDTTEIMENSVKQKSGYSEFYNRIVFYFDYDESGGDSADNFESVYIAIDATSQGSSEMDEIKSKEIKSKWIKSLTFAQIADTNAKIYHASKANAAGNGNFMHIVQLDGTITVTNGSSAVAGTSTIFTKQAFADDKITIAGIEYTINTVINDTSLTLTDVYDLSTKSGLTAGITEKIRWQAPGSTDYGEPVNIDKSGKYTSYDIDKNKYVRVVVNAAGSSNFQGSVPLTTISSTALALAVADKLLKKYRNPKSIVNFKVDINDAVLASEFIKPADYIQLTAADAAAKGQDVFAQEEMMILSIQPDTKKSTVEVQAIQSGFIGNYGFIGSGGAPWDGATASEKQYAFISDGNDQIGPENGPGFITI